MRAATVFVLFSAIAGFGAAFFFRSKPEAAHHLAAPAPTAATAGSQPSNESSAPASLPSAPADANTQPASATSLGAAAATPALAPHFQTGNAAQSRAASADSELLAVRGMLRDYRATFGQNPVGTNREITRALLGNNPRGVRFTFSADAAGREPRLDERGQLLDRWSRPYFFHQLSGNALEVRSAGPDGVMWNADDEVSR